jgi:hypothetical protein
MNRKTIIPGVFAPGIYQIRKLATIVITTSMIIGYELQVRRVGEAVATSNGQAFYPIYLLAVSWMIE